MNMKYKATVIIRKPNSNRTRILGIDIEFGLDPTDRYMHANYSGHCSGEDDFDLRYDASFDPDKPMHFIVRTYENIYDGQNGAWLLDAIAIEKEEGGQYELGRPGLCGRQMPRG